MTDQQPPEWSAPDPLGPPTLNQPTTGIAGSSENGAPAKKSRKKLIIGGSIAALLVIGGIASATSKKDDEQTVSEAPVVTEVETTEATAAPVTTPAPTGPPTTPAPTTTAAPCNNGDTTDADVCYGGVWVPKPPLTVSQKNAIKEAESYLEFTAFSRLGLIGQLSSEFGSQFTIEDSTFAVDSLNVDWNAQAVKSAESYLEFSSFSCQGLIDQLSSEYGSEFTVEQATYGATQVGLCG